MIKEGDIVTLKTDSPEMTVSTVSGHMAQCVYFPRVPVSGEWGFPDKLEVSVKALVKVKKEKQ